MSVTTGASRCGIFSYTESSSILGSIMIVRTSAGEALNSSDNTIALSATDLARKHFQRFFRITLPLRRRLVQQRQRRQFAFGGTAGEHRDLVLALRALALHDRRR